MYISLFKTNLSYRLIKNTDNVKVPLIKSAHKDKDITVIVINYLQPCYLVHTKEFNQDE